MSRDESLLLKDIQEACDKVLRFRRGMNYRSFVQDELRFDAVLRNLEIIGEAVKNISEDTRQKYLHVKWGWSTNSRNGNSKKCIRRGRDPGKIPSRQGRGSQVVVTSILDLCLPRLELARPYVESKMGTV